MLGAMTSLTGGGGFAAGDATSGNGDQTLGGSSFGGINFGQQGPNWGLLAALAVIGIVLWKS